MDIQNITNVSTVVINSLLMLLKDNHIDVNSVVMQLSNNKDEAISPEVNLGELTQQTLDELQKAKAQKVAVPEGFVLVPEDQAKDTERLNFLLCGNSCIRTVVKRDIENEDYEKTGEHFLFTEVYWIDGWDYLANTSSQSERGAIDKAMIEAQEQLG